MTTMPPDKTTASEPIWQVVAFSDYARPAPPTRDAATNGFSQLWRRIRGKDSNPPPQRPENQLNVFSEAALSRLVPPIDWHPAARALEDRLGGWPRPDRRDASVRLFIGPPMGGHADLLREWAGLRGWPIIAPPTPEQILSREASWLSQWPDRLPSWVFPTLERCYLRHANGLALVRAFLERAFSGRLGIGLVGCDSWAGSFLQKVWPALHADALTLQAFGGDRLTAYFGSLAKAAGPPDLCFRESDTGRAILPTADASASASSTAAPFLTQLAALSRGHIGIAREIWRSSLCAEPEDEEGAATEGKETQPVSRRRTVWLRSPVKTPAVPSEPDPDVAFVLHCLLLHDGMTEDLLARLLPLPVGRIGATLHRLSQTGIVGEEQGVWRVSAQGYPVVRQFLKGNGYLVDPY